MKKMYQIPELQVILLKKADVIVTSDDVLPWSMGDSENGGDFAVFG